MVLILASILAAVALLVIATQVLWVCVAFAAALCLWICYVLAKESVQEQDFRRELTKLEKQHRDEVEEERKKR